MSQNDLTIRNSTTEFLIFEKQSHADSIEVRYEDEPLWLTQKMMAQLFDVETNTITYHLKEVFDSAELEKQATTRKFRVVQTEGSRQVPRTSDHYNLDAVISVGYRVNSIRATQRASSRSTALCRTGYMRVISADWKQSVPSSTDKCI